MGKNKVNLLDIAPMRDYTPPSVPTLDEMRKDSVVLQKLPKRWVKNAAILAGVGVLSLSVLAGCADRDADDGLCGQVTVHDTTSSYNMVFRLHHGGLGIANYVVHLTEQEVFGIIRRGLEAAGLRFCDEPPGYMAFEGNDWLPPIALDLFDAERNIAISHLAWEHSFAPFRPRAGDAARMYEALFARETDITIGAFYTPHYNLRTRDSLSDRQMRTARRRARPVLEAAVEDQIADFIAQLRHQGIID